MTSTDRVAAMAEGRRADTARRRQRVIKALNDAAVHGEDLTVAAVARTAGVDRTFLYRHRDLLGQVHAMAAQPATSGNSMTPSRASLQADLLATQQRASTPESVNSSNACPNSSASRPGASPASARPTTSTSSSNASPTWNNNPLTYRCRLRNAIRTWPPPAPRTENS